MSLSWVLDQNKFQHQSTINPLEWVICFQYITCIQFFVQQFLDLITIIFKLIRMAALHKPIFFPSLIIFFFSFEWRRFYELIQSVHSKLQRENNKKKASSSIEKRLAPQCECVFFIYCFRHGYFDFYAAHLFAIVFACPHPFTHCHLTFFICAILQLSMICCSFTILRLVVVLLDLLLDILTNSKETAVERYIAFCMNSIYHSAEKFEVWLNFRLEYPLNRIIHAWVWHTHTLDQPNSKCRQVRNAQFLPTLLSLHEWKRNMISFNYNGIILNCQCTKTLKTLKTKISLT